MTVVEQPRQMTLAELQQSEEFGSLTTKQRLFVTKLAQAYLDGGLFDASAATAYAFTCKTPQIARRFSYQLLAHPKIILVLNRFFGSTPQPDFLKAVERAAAHRKLTVRQIRSLQIMAKDSGQSDAILRAVLIAEVERQLKAAEPGSVAAKDLLAQLERLLAVPLKSSEPRQPAAQCFPIGAIIEQDGVEYEVVAQERSRK